MIRTIMFGYRLPLQNIHPPPLPSIPMLPTNLWCDVQKKIHLLKGWGHIRHYDPIGKYDVLNIYICTVNSFIIRCIISLLLFFILFYRTPIAYFICSHSDRGSNRVKKQRKLFRKETKTKRAKFNNIWRERTKSIAGFTNQLI